jgi:hypothetical protein
MTSPSPQPYTFELYGLPFETLESVPHTFPCASSAAAPLRLRAAPVTAHLPHAIVEDEHVQGTEDTLLFRHPKAPRLKVTAGSAVDAEPRDGRYSDDEYWYTVLSVAAAFAGLQRGHFALHAATVAFDGVAIAIAGEPGAGKSTLATALCAEGATLVTEDLSLIQRQGGQWIVGRGPSQVRLLPDAMERFQVEGIGRRSYDRKRFVDLPSARVPPPLRDIYVLRIGDSGDRGRIRPLTAMQAMQALLENNRFCIRPDCVPGAAREKLFRIVAALANELRFFEVLRQPGLGGLHALVEGLTRQMRSN